MNLSRFPQPIRFRRPTGRSGRLTLLASLVAASCALTAPVAVASASGASAEVSVRNANGKAAELLHRLTIPQLAAALKTTPAKLSAEAEGSGGKVSLELGEVLGNPVVTLQEVLNGLAAQGVSAAPLQQAINRLLAGGTESAEQLRSTVDAVLADLREGGQIGAIAKELGLPPAVVEAVHLLPTTVGALASDLHTTTEHLTSVLQGAGAVLQPLLPATPLVSSTVERALQGGTSVLVGAPTGAGGLSLTNVSSTAPAQPGTAAQAPVSNAFSIVSIKVRKDGAILETVRLPGAGQLAIKATATQKVAVRSKSGRKRSFTRKATVASLSTALSAGLHTLTLRPKGTAGVRRLLVQLATTYTPTGGSPNTIRRSVVVSRAGGKRRH
jgi:hypothetical protein